ncbi:SHS2 domain-containing protein [Thermosporothrix hazakensis]|jgi:SHS2 domain-containing protein|uniref:SHS2 domain-containing protein n=2 Tax=Thermosporothrix TaxID=768650 RepID=A0A326TVY4_THEHA|nr:archease [Thermosporothrix hazakensis]PZW21076.1 SHS2 domain-containing protein [Thermosporothrix hazakensis]BBH88208.1 archease [Thermosporothrix sp. COM3]GCE46396.1 archease [Thermosporothrix hazakensis]
MAEFTQSYEVFEHTADVGIHAYGRTLEELFAAAALGMESLMIAPEQLRVETSREVIVEEQNLLALLIAWLNELVFLFDTEFLLFREVEILELSEQRLRARVGGEPYDAERHELSSAIKAVTWHEASITSVDGGYRARVIFDI